jgi:hypothetical protein
MVIAVLSDFLAINGKKNGFGLFLAICNYRNLHGSRNSWRSFSREREVIKLRRRHTYGL